jgi:enoyl-CoA hydratase/carnithine racemase
LAATTAMAVVLSEVVGGVGVLTLNRPARLNAWTAALQRQLYGGLRAFEADEAVRAIVVTGAGRGFCAGADLGGLDSIASGGGEDSGGGDKKARAPPAGLRGEEQREEESFLLPMFIKKPIIAAINGAVAGIGFGFALTCDIRFANRDAKFCGAFSKRGLVAEWGAAAVATCR